MDLLGKKNEKSEEPNSEYGEVKSYIIKELNKGFTIKQIREKLLIADWDNELIDFAIKEIMNKKQRLKQKIR